MIKRHRHQCDIHGDYKRLKLTLKKQWFDMVLSGEKKEEYREIKPHWIKRFCNPNGDLLSPCRDYLSVEFRNGYNPYSPIVVVQCLGVTIGNGKTKWGGHTEVEYYVIKLGDVIFSENIEI